MGTGDPKDPVKGLELSVVSCTIPSQKAERSVPEAEESVLEVRR